MKENYLVMQQEKESKQAKEWAQVLKFREDQKEKHKEWLKRRAKK
jgi:hypothetical protein